MSLRRLLSAALLTVPLCTATALSAQDPLPPTPRPRPPAERPRLPGDTARAPVDTVRIPVDTVRNPAAERDSLLRVDSIRTADAVRDSLRRAFPDMTAGGRTGFTTGVWEWDRLAIMREGAITIGDLLRRIPGMHVLRSGGYVQPEAITAFGQTRGRVQYELDGYILDPLQESTYDVAGIELINIVSLRVERRLDITRVKIVTAMPTVGTPYTRIEAATGEPDMNAFRAIFLVPYVVAGPLGVALDRVDTDGLNGNEPASALTGWAKWTWTNGSRGLQLEYRRQNIERESLPWPTERTRSDVLLRARSRLLPGLTAELYGGRSQLAVEPPDTTSGDALPEDEREQALERSTWQAGARAALSFSTVNIDGAVRMRTNDALPIADGELNADVGIASLLRLGGGVSLQAWRYDRPAFSYDVRAEAGPVAGLSAFAELADGRRGAPYYQAFSGVSVLETHTVTDRSALRVGGAFDRAFRRFALTGGGAFVRMDGDVNESFRLPFDSAFAGSPMGAMGKQDGIEAWGRLGLFRNRIALDGSYTFWQDVQDWLYLPARSWRVAGEAHLSPLESGNLEILGRIEHVRRGPMLVGVVGDPATETVPAAMLLNGYLQIRVIDVRAFIQWEDMLGDGRMDVPGRIIRGPRFFYGVKWELLN